MDIYEIERKLSICPSNIRFKFFTRCYIFVSLLVGITLVSIAVGIASEVYSLAQTFVHARLGHIIQAKVFS